MSAVDVLFVGDVVRVVNPRGATFNDYEIGDEATVEAFDDYGDLIVKWSAVRFPECPSTEASRLNLLFKDEVIRVGGAA